MQLTGPDHPPRSGDRFLSRGAVDEAVAEDLRTLGVAVVQGPAGSGTSWLAMAAARRWDGPVTWIRPGLWIHLHDLIAPLWAGSTPDVVQQGTAGGLVDAILSRLSHERRLLVIDDLDEIMTPTTGPARIRDHELGLLLGALDAGALRSPAFGHGGVLLATRRTPPGLDVPSRPVPPLSPEDGRLLAGEAPFPDAWLRRPAALTLARFVPPDADPIEDDAPWPGLVRALAVAHLKREEQELLLGLAVVRNPAPAQAIAEMVDFPREWVDDVLLKLMNLGLAEQRAEGWRCSRHVAAGAREVLPAMLPGVLPLALQARLGGWYIRTGQGFGEGWTSAEPTRSSRLGLRYAAAAKHDVMALTFALHGGTSPLLERFRAWRALRDDLGLALALGPADRPPEELGAGWIAQARAAMAISDHGTAEGALRHALPLAEEASDPVLLRQVHGHLARRSLLAGSPAQAGTHLRSALALTTDPVGRCDLHNQLGVLALQTGDLEAAEHAFAASLQLAEQVDDPRRRGSRTAGLAGVRLYRGSLTEAGQLLRDAVAIGREVGDDDGVAHRLGNLVLVELLRGDINAGRRALRDLAAVGGGPSDRSRCRFLSLRAGMRRAAGDLDGASGDLAEASTQASDAGDRELVADLAGSAGHITRIAGHFDAAAGAFDRALGATAEGVDPALRASRTIDRENAAAWAAAKNRATSPLLAAGRALGEALREIPPRPFFPRHLTAAIQAAEGQLLGAMLAGTTPIGQMRQLQRLLDVASDDPERASTGEPAARACLAWAMKACGRHEESKVQAERARMDARIQGLATIEGRCAVLLGEEPPPWHGQARLLAELLGQDR
ncbi:MAG: tetratricopeptide repeat protein [Proteobacteria bacterium]|nr:tetratricopeptide repeat protein [Pseudomonadota bacterium]